MKWMYDLECMNNLCETTLNVLMKWTMCYEYYVCFQAWISCVLVDMYFEACWAMHL